MENNCRICGNSLFDQPLLEYANMPGVAQYMPSQEDLKDDYGVDLKICQCSGCDLVQLNNDPVPYYREVIRATSFSPEMTAFRREQFKIFLKDYRMENKKIIEIGCGTGHYLSILSEFDVDARGIEFSPSAVEICRSNELNVEPGFIDDRTARLKNAPFDVFLIMSFLEHLPEPNETLGGIYNNLIPEGIGLVEVPNFDMILKNNLFAEFIGDHIFYFTEATLKRTLNINGFDVLDCRPVWYDYILSAVVKKRAGLDLSRFQAHRENLKRDVTNYLKKFPENTVVIWGAGHQSLAIISLLGLGDKIRYVVDSATFKQGKYTPATHIRIVEPDRLNLDPPAAVIVIAASYSDEVVSIIRKDYSPDIKISILRDFGLEKIS